MKAIQWELVGIVFIVLVGSFLHLGFELSGYSKIIALIATVNESVWEHLKLGFWPAVFYALIEYPFLKRPNFLIAKGLCIYVIPLSIVVLFYAYTALLGYNTLVMDILIFVVAVIMGQLISYKILILQELPHTWNMAVAAAVIFLVILFMVFTFYPPHLSIFRDPFTGGYGII
ncbi:MAG: hypothetical protein HXS48_12385 [Theionarchaea archaeon]|nr:hypothetical protein [Theionarchaea archaeon]